jgi:hypothetical protein
MHNYWQRSWMTYHSTIGWWHIPGVTAKVFYKEKSYFHNANSVGMRSFREYPIISPSHRNRILLLGDSFSYGAMVNTEHTFANVLEEENPQLDVLNFALVGSGTDQQVLIYQSLAKPFHIDLCVLAVYIENIARNLQHCRPSAWDIHNNAKFYRPKPYYLLKNRQLQLHNCPVPLERRTVKKLGDWRFPIIDTVCAYKEVDNYAWTLMKTIIQKLRNDLVPIPLMLLLLPDFGYYLHDYPAYYQFRFQELSNELPDIEVLDMLTEFEKLTLSQRLACHYPDDNHYTPLGHQIVANALQSSLLERFSGFGANHL